jgi:hypothetical protein
MWDPQHLTTLWASTACYGNSFTLFYCCVRMMSDVRSPGYDQSRGLHECFVRAGGSVPGSGSVAHAPSCTLLTEGVELNTRIRLAPRWSCTSTAPHVLVDYAQG